MIKRKMGIITVLILCFLAPAGVWALDFSGEAGAGGIQGRNGQGSGFALVHASPDCNGNSIVGYRFSVYDKLQNKRGKGIDIYRSGAAQNGSVCRCSGGICTCSDQVPWSQFGFNGNSLLNADGMFLDKMENKAGYHKKEAFSLAKTGQNKYIETGLLVASYFPAYENIQKWLEIDQNIRIVISLCLGEGKALNYMDMLIVEPIYCCFVEHLSCGLTVSDLARISNFYYGNVFPGAAAGATEFAWIRSWALYYFPNMLSVTDSGKASLLGLNPGTKLKGGTNPSRLIDGAYGMVVCTELSDSTERPRLCIEKMSVFDKDTLVEELMPGENGASRVYLNPGKEYRFVIETSQETSPYPCELTFSSFGAMEESFFMQGMSTDKWEIKTVLGNDDKTVLFEVGENWVSETGELIQKGEVASFRLNLAPKVDTEAAFFNEGGKLIYRAYEGQKVRMRVRQRADSRWAEKTDSFITTCLGDTWEGSLAYQAIHEKTYEFKVPKDVKMYSYQLQTQWKEKQVMLEQREGGLPVYQAELEIVNISLSDEKNEEEAPDNLSVGKRIWPTVAIKSNVEVSTEVLVNYSIDGEVLQSFKVMLNGPLEQIHLNSFILTEEKEYTLKASVLLPESEEDPELEEDMMNNSMDIKLLAHEPLQMEVMQAGLVMPEEKIITAIKIENKSFDDFCGENKVWVKLKRENGEIKNLAVTSLVCPAGETTYLPIRWEVPLDTEDSEQLTLIFEYILYRDGGIPRTVKTTFKVQKELFAETENTALQAPKNVEQLSRLARRLNEKYTDNSGAVGEVEWQTWNYEEGIGFGKELYKLTYSLTTSIVEAEHIHSVSNEGLTIRSGYGVVLKSEWKWSLTKNNRRCANYEFISDESRVSYLYFENGYQEAAAKATQLKDFSKTVKHYTPVWTPDGKYTVFVKMGGFWTPAGEIVPIAKAECRIEGSIFDDYFVTQG